MYSKIALAFDTDALSGAYLKRVECRSTLCKVVFEADSDVRVQRILPRQLADTFNKVVTVHATKVVDNVTQVYIDIPSSS